MPLCGVMPELKPVGIEQGAKAVNEGHRADARGPDQR
jgi:hypothetical protein